MRPRLLIRALTALGLAAALLTSVVPAPPAIAADRLPGGGCDPIVPTECLLPFPDDWYTRADPASPTGRRVAFTPGTLPAAFPGRPIDPAAWNRATGFSPGSTLLVQAPGLDLAVTGTAPITDIGRSLRPDAPIVLLDAETGVRWPYWAELDANATSAGRQALLIHPARNFLDGHRYLVALRGFKDAAGVPLTAPGPFARIAGPDLPATDPLRPRQRQLRPVLHQLARHGIAPGTLYLAWDFTVAATADLTGDLTAIRDDAFRRLGDRSPGYVITKVTDHTEAEDARIAREVEGVLTVPSYLNLPGGPPGSTFFRGPDGRPRRLPLNTQAAGFRCEIPRGAFTTPSTPALYGHGLLGSRDEVAAGNVKAMAAEHDFTFCATDWIGMASGDIPVVIGALLDPNLFPAIPERSQQGMLDALFLGRALVHPGGFTADKAFRTADGRPLVDNAHGLGYDGNSQGGILGGALVAVSPDIRRGVLGVTGMNYGLLLDRSADFARFQGVLDLSYPDKLNQQIVLGLFQMLWDHGETDGYAGRLTDGHQVLMHIAYGDHQVANIAAEVEARTIGARLVTPALAPGRSPDRIPYWDIPSTGPLPYHGSAMVVWDSGTPSPPLTNTAPTEGKYGRDPHGDPRNMATARRQKAVFLRTGEVVDVCGGAPCQADPG
ncbi:hypothetical protein ORV05_12180 [Amycolatopsis cynarae]|uniref:ATP-dependent DNA helicase RecG n=1 Tax=Amycolatopsis cynarae TaxID=2995223 RepID=A0ABY7B971_9PSEU|nr:hypothetical protein [Amycolatopsis sp. HUAS 11-8]WAL68489.1 hypothetical protein ORV05_12180 [Amycolatopsis sp. HUAS 11-8]